MIERLADPLVHLIRNSADHGLEDAATCAWPRAKAPPVTSSIVARHAGGEVFDLDQPTMAAVSISETHPAKSRRRQGLVAPGAVSFPTTKTNALDFRTGLLDRAGGVGAIRTRGRHGRRQEDDREHARRHRRRRRRRTRGRRSRLRLPLTLAIIEGLLVRVADTQYSSFHSPQWRNASSSPISTTQRSEGRSFLNIRGDLIPFLRLRELFCGNMATRMHSRRSSLYRPVTRASVSSSIRSSAATRP